MAFAAVLDTCVLYPAHLRDTLLRLAERGLYRPLWSADIIDELHRNLIEVVDSEAVDRLLEQMTTAFPDAEVTGHRALIDGLTCDSKDRHVLAAAVRADAGAIVRSTPRTSLITASRTTRSRSSTLTPSSLTCSISPPAP